MEPQLSLWWGEDGEGICGSLVAPTELGTGRRRAGDLVRRPEPCVPEGPERYLATGRDHQVGNAAAAEGEAEPALWRKCGARHTRLRKTAWPQNCSAAWRLLRGCSLGGHFPSGSALVIPSVSGFH